jgi:hypothetical protein
MSRSPISKILVIEGENDGCSKGYDDVYKRAIVVALILFMKA